MTSEFWRHFRLAIAISLVCTWAVTWLADTPVLRSTNLLLVIAPFVQYTSAQWNRPVAWRTRDFGRGLLMIAALVGVVFLFSHLVSDAEMGDFTHSAAFIVPIWVLSTWGLVLQATRVVAKAREEVERPSDRPGRRRST